MQEPGDILGGRYRLDERIGSGGMGDVYRAEDLLLRRPVAVKLLLPSLANDPDVVARFQREARAAAALHHPNIVTLFDQGDNGAPFLVMELVEGGSVIDLLRGNDTLPVARAIEIASEVLDALDHAHQRGVVHCDVKADNVLLTVDGRAKLADFGIARVASEATLTRTGQVHGSAHYLAPERLAGEVAPPASDIYATGVLLYRMLTSRFPFAGDHPAAIAVQHQQRAPRPPSDLRPDIPDWLDAVVLRALAKRPAERFPSAGAMRAALLDGTPAETDQPTRPVAAAMPAPDAATRVVPAAVPAPPAGITRTRGIASPRRRPVWPAAFVALAALAALVVLVAALSGGGESTDADAGSEIASVPTETVVVPPAEAAMAPTMEPTQSAEQAVPPEPTPTSQPAAEATAPVADGVAGDPQSHLDTLRSLVGEADTSRWKPNTQRDLLRRIDDIEQRLASDKPKDVEGKIDDLGEKVSDLADRGELDPALASRILNELDALETSTDQGAATPP